MPVAGVPPWLTPQTNPYTGPTIPGAPTAPPGGNSFDWGSLPWGEILGGLGGLLSAGGGIWGAQNTNQTNQANLAAQMMWQQQMLGMAQGQMQQGQNPYSQMIMQFLGGQAPTPGTPGLPPGAPPLAPPGAPPTGPIGPTGPTGPVTGPTSGSPFGPPLFSVMPGLPTSGPTTWPHGAPPDPGAPGSIGGLTMNQFNPLAFGGATPNTINLQGLQNFNPTAGAASSMQSIMNIAAPAQTAALTPISVDNPTAFGPSQVSANNISVGGSQGFNTGQDALMQMLRGGPSFGPDANITNEISRFLGGSTSPTQNLLQSLESEDRRLLEEQVSGLRGSSGSLGQRLGSDMMRQESDLRQQFAGGVASRNAGIMNQAFENSQGRSLDALGLGTQREQFFAGQGLQGQGQQAQMAQMLGSMGLGQQGLDAQIAQQNAGNQLTASQNNAQNMLQQQLQTQALGQESGQFNAANMLAMQQLFSQQQMQASLANQQTNFGVGQANLGAQTQYGLQNMQNLFQAGTNNQQWQNQGAFQNADILNQLGMFNAQNQMQQGMFNSQQGLNYNQFMLGGIGQAAGQQNQQQSLNAQLLGILGGVGVPSQQPSAYPGALQNAGMMAMLPWLMR